MFADKARNAVACLVILCLISLFQEEILLTFNGVPLGKQEALQLKLSPISPPFSSSGLYTAAFLDDRNSEVVIKVFNFNQSQYFSVLAEVPETYIIAARQEKQSSTQSYLVFRFNLPPTVAPHNTTAFKVSVYMTEDEKQATLVEPSPFLIDVPFVGAIADHHKEDKVYHNGRSGLPPCQTTSDILLSDGWWRGPKATLRDSQNYRMRTGWNFEPHKCNLEVFTKQDIERLLAKPVTIAVLGTSVERGVFLSLVDMLTSPSEKIEFAESKVTKCWGRAEVQLGNLTLLYQDMRAPLMRVPTDSTHVIITCDGDLLSGAPDDLFRNGTEMVRILLRDSNPDVIVSHSGCFDNAHYEDTNCRKTLEELISLAAPRDLWNGTWILTDPDFNAFFAFPSKEDSVVHNHNIRQMLSDLNDSRLRILDSSGLSGPMELYAEDKGYIRRSQHYHSVCNTVEDEIQICSNVTEAVAQAILGISFAPRGKAAAFESIGEWKPPAQRTLRACYDCPYTLLPFHIKAVPNLVCEDGFRLSEQVGEPFFIPCPAYCLATEPTGTTQTQSGVVEVRQCERINNTGS